MLAWKFLRSAINDNEIDLTVIKIKTFDYPTPQVIGNLFVEMRGSLLQVTPLTI